MTEASKRFLWLSADSSRCFLIPSGPTFLSGAFAIANYEGDELGVREESILNFEVSREEAKQYLEEQLRHSGEELKKAFNILALFSDGVSPLNVPLPNDADENKEVMEKLLATLLGTASEKEGTDQAETRQKVKEYLSSGEAKEIFSEMSGKLDKLSQQLKHPGKLGDNLPEIIASLAGSLEEEEDILKAEKRKEDLKKTISESIAASLRKKQP